LRKNPGLGACDVIVTYQKRPRFLACGQWIFVHHIAHSFQTRMLIDHGRLRVCVAQGAHDERQITYCPHDLRSERVGGWRTLDLPPMRVPHPSAFFEEGWDRQVARSSVPKNHDESREAVPRSSQSYRDERA